MKPGAIILTGLVTSVLGLAVGVFLIGGSGGTDATPPVDDSEKLELRQEVSHLRKMLESGESAARPTPVAEPESAAVGDAPASVETPAEDESAVDASGPRFLADEYNGVLKKVDWDTVGPSMRSMASLIAEVARSLTAGEQPSQRKVQEIQKLNNDLVTAAATVHAELPGTGINGSFTSPPFMANAIAAALEAAGHPLSDEQAKSIEPVARRFADQDVARIAAYDDQSFELLKLCEESELKRGFFDQVFAHLNADQLAVVQDPGVRNRVRLDIFSDALIYPGRLGITWFEKREDLAQSYLGGVVQRFGLKPEQKEPAKTVIQIWVDELPDALIDAPVDRLDKKGIVSARRATAWGRATLVLLEALISEIALTEDQIATIRGAGFVLVPLRKTLEGE